MLTCARICLLALLLGASLRATAGQPLMFITEAYPPDNILRGIAVDLLVIASLNTEQPVQRGQIRLMPWARATACTSSGLASSTQRAMPRAWQMAAACTVIGSAPSGSTIRLLACWARWIS